MSMRKPHWNKTIIESDPLLDRAAQELEKSRFCHDYIINDCCGCPDLKNCIGEWDEVIEKQDGPLTIPDLLKLRAGRGHMLAGCMVFILFWFNAHPGTLPFIHHVSSRLS